MTEQDLNGPQIGAGFQQVSRKAMSERVHSDVLVQPRGETRRLAGFIHRLVGERPTVDISWEEPGAGLVDLAAPVSFPVFPEQSQQPRREHDVAILGPLGLTDANDHALAIDVVDAQGQDLGDSKAGGVGGHEDGPMAKAGDRLEEASDLLEAQDDRELGLTAGAGQAVEAPVLAECDAVEELEGTQGLVVGARGDLPVVGELKQVGPDLGSSQEFG